MADKVNRFLDAVVSWVIADTVKKWAGLIVFLLTLTVFGRLMFQLFQQLRQLQF